MYRSLFTALTLSLCCAHASAHTLLRVAVPDIGAGTTPAGGGLVDVIHNQHLLEQAFAADGIEVKWLFFKGAGPLINESIASGQVDMAYLGDLASIVGKANGLDTRIVAVAARGVSHYLAVPPDSPVKNLADLRGKTVGLFRGTAAQLSFIQALNTAGMTEKDVRVVNLDFVAASAALAARQIDATWGGANVLALRDKGLAAVPLSTRSLGGAGELAGLVLVTGALAQAHPDWPARIAQVQRQAADWAAAPEHRDAYLRLQADQAAYPEAILRADLEGAAPLSVLLSPTPDPAFIARLQQAVEVALKARLIRRDVQVRDWLATPPPGVPAQTAAAH
ncbi:ABC transporter substrate-binding protein [Pseudomonas sp.]|uniref:ABC transporter substrate-binding protein n=1 Tax=Pseudomonas sp. TaxID=306 RepID=UPI00258A48F1|nr:ABC transporter substrate-binding protein [Pseudomonas sp.]